MSEPDKTPQDVLPTVPALGRCRRHAPTMNGYPVVFESDWCGDHKLNELYGVGAVGADPWAHRHVSMRCASCMWYVRKAL